LVNKMLALKKLRVELLMLKPFEEATLIVT
jgi:hypothetical protein